MTWFSWALLSGFFYTWLGLLTRSVLKNNHDALSFSFYFSCIAAMVCLPFIGNGFHFTTLWLPWLILVFISGLIVGQNYLVFYSSQFLPASISGTISKFRLIWLLILGCLFLQEVTSWEKFWGTILTVLAGSIVIFQYQKTKNYQSVWLAMAATLLYAVVASIYKYLFNYFSVAQLTFFIFFFPAMINYLLIPNAQKRLWKYAQVNGKSIIVVGILGGLANLCMNTAFAVGEISRVGVIIEAFLVATLVGEHFWLREREHLFVKILAVVLAVTGAILIKL